MQLNKFLAHSGVCSRRKAVELIQTERVTVNGTIINQPGYRVEENARVMVDGEGIRREEKVYLMLNKPRGYITTVSDEHNRKTVMDLLSTKIRRRVYPVGRLDQDSSGLLLMTNDGTFAQQIAHPRNHIQKRYQVQLDKPITSTDLEQIRQGTPLMDGMLRVDDITVSTTGKHRYTQLVVTLHSGKNRIVRRLFEHFSYQVVRLDRIAIGSLSKTDLPSGEWRFLTRAEMASFAVSPSKKA